jgi:hypothetical protein
MIEIMQDNLNELNESQREPFVLHESLTWKIKTVSQARSHREMLEGGFLLQIPGKITTLLAKCTMMGHRNGSSMVISSYNGNLLVQIRFYGFTENVCTELRFLPFSLKLTISHLQPVQGRAWFGKFIVLRSCSENLWNWSVPLSWRISMTVFLL